MFGMEGLSEVIIIFLNFHKTLVKNLPLYVLLQGIERDDVNILKNIKRREKFIIQNEMMSFEYVVE